MKYIVLYTITILWITTSGAAGQTPTINLLPSNKGRIHPEAMIDTSTTNDSLNRIKPLVRVNSQAKIKQAEQTPLANKKQQKPSGLDSLFQKRESNKVRVNIKPRKYPLIFARFNPIRIFIRITVLNI